jgi:ribosome-associated toxin RatA of RatAB toxin-antitoxin module
MPTAKTLVLLAAAMAASATHAVSQPLGDSGQGGEQQVTITDFSNRSSPGRTFAANTVIDAPLQKLCAIIQDYAGYSQFMPNTDNAKVVQAAGDYSVVEMSLKLLLGKMKRYRLRLEPKVTLQACHLSWKQVPWEELKPDDTIADTSGYWHLTPHPAHPSKTVVEYFVYADPGYVPFGFRWIVDLMSKESLPKTLEALRGRALQ